MKAFSPARLKAGFTLVELLVVIGIILILMGLVLTVIPIVKYRAQQLKAKSTTNQITVALNAYHAEHAKFPSLRSITDSQADPNKDEWAGDPAMGASIHNNALFHTLRNIPKGPNANDANNPRRVTYLTFAAATVSRTGTPRDGFFDRKRDGSPPGADQDGNLYDPWGREYGIVMDTSGDERIDLDGIYVDFAGADRVSGKAPRVLSGAFSMGRDETLGSKGDRTYMKDGEESDDVVSWK